MPLLPPPDESLDLAPPVLPDAPRVPLAQVGHLQGLPPVNARRAWRPRLPRLRRRTLVLLLIVLGAPALVVFGPRPLEVRPEDRAVAPSAVMLGRYWRGFRFDGDAESLEREREWDGTETVRYLYRPDDGSAAMRVLIWSEDSEAEASETFRRSSLHTVFDWGLGLPGRSVGLVDLDPQNRWAAESAVYRVEHEGETLGYSVSLRQGRHALQARVRGGELRPEALRSLFLPFLRRASRGD